MIRRRALLGGAYATGLGIGMPMVSRVAAARGATVFTMMIGVAAGSSLDRVARDFAAVLARHLPWDGDVQAVIEAVNRPGNAGHDMLTRLAAAGTNESTPAGATFGWVVTPTLPARAIDRNDPGLPGRIRLLGQVQREPIAFVSRADNPAESVQDIVRRASEDADAIPLATPQPGSPPHLAALRLQGVAQTRMNILTFPSPAAARQALLAGTVSAAALGLSEVIDAVLDGTLSALGITAHRRFGLLPDTPILDETGIPLKAFIRRGLGIPAGLHGDEADRLITGAKAAAADPAYQAQAERAGYYAGWVDAAVWEQQMRAEQVILTHLWETDPWIASSSG